MIKKKTYLFEISTEVHYEDTKYYESNLKSKDRLKSIWTCTFNPT